MRPQEEDGLPQHLLSSLIASTPWNEQVQSLTHLTELALSPSQQTLRQLRSLAPYFQSAINNPRSTLVRSVCETISTLAETLKAPFVEAVGNSVIPDLLNRSAVTKAVIRESCVDAARSMFEYGVEGVHVATVRTLAELVSDRRAPAPTRATAALFLGMILVDNCREGLNHIIKVVAAAIATGCSDPDESVRATSRENWRRLHALDPAIASEVLKKLPLQTVQLINRERDEFGDPFRADRDRALRARMPGMADMPARFVPRVGFKPVRVETDGVHHTKKKARPHLRPPRRSILPAQFINQSSPDDDSPPKRHEMHPARRVFSPMAIDTPGPAHTPASAETPTPVDTAYVTVDMPTPVETVPENDLRTPKSEEAPENDLCTPKSEGDPNESENVAPMSPDAITEKSAVSTVSSSSGSHSATSDSQNPSADHAGRMTESSMSSLATTEDSVSAVSSSSVSAASTPPSGNLNGHTFQKIAGSGASRGTNEDSSSETPTRSLHSDSSSVSAHASSPDTKKGRISFILGANQTPRPYTPLPPISRLVDPQNKMQTFTPMDICTPMKNDETGGPLSGIVVKALARALEDGLDEVAPSHEGSNGDQPCDVPENAEGLVKEDKSPARDSDVSGEQHVDKESSAEEDDTVPVEDQTDVEKSKENAGEAVLETVEQTPEDQEPTKIAEQSTQDDVSESRDLPSTPDSIDDELLKKVASITNSAEKTRDPEVDPSENSSWDALVQDLESTLGIRAPLTDDKPEAEVKDSIERTVENTEATAKVEVVKPGEGKENRLPGVPRKQPEIPKLEPEAKPSTKMEEKEKTEMTKAERQAALARRPPRRSINPGAIKPMPVENKTVRPSLAPQVPPKTERRKPPVPSFNRKPPVPGKSKPTVPSKSNPPTASNNSATRRSATAKQPPGVARKPPMTARKTQPTSTARKPPTTTARKLPPSRPRTSTALMRPGTSAPPVSSVRRSSTPPTRTTQPSVTTTATVTSTAQSSAASKPVSRIPPMHPKAPKAPTRNQTPRQIAVIDAYRACARAKKADWSTKWKSLKNLEATIGALQGDSLPPRLCDDAAGLLGEYIQETHHKIQLSALDALFFLLLCTERPPQIAALNRAFEKRPEMLRRVLGLLKDGREDARLACGRVMQSFEVLFGPEIQIALLVRAVSGVEGKIAEMGCVHMLKTFERAKQGEGFVWKAGVLEALVSLLAGLKQNRRVEVRQSATKVLDAVKECLPDRAFEIVCRKVGVSV